MGDPGIAVARLQSYVKVQEDTSKPDYSIDHSGLVYLMGKDGEYITHFAYGTPAASSRASQL